jgi:hypothetical protein
LPVFLAHCSLALASVASLLSGDKLLSKHTAYKSVNFRRATILGIGIGLVIVAVYTELSTIRSEEGHWNITITVPGRIQQAGQDERKPI